MKLPTPIFLSSLLSAALALNARQNACSFRLRTGGADTSDVSQFESGQVRAGMNGQATFNINGNTLTDEHGRGCWWTPPSLVLQCDVGQSPDTGFGIGCDGLLSYQGQSRFQQCRTGGAGDPIMIYREPRGSECSEITLQADGCRPNTCDNNNGGGGGDGGETSSSLPLQELTGLPGIIGMIPTSTSTSAPANTGTQTLPLQSLTGLPGLIGAIPGVGSSSPPGTTGTGTLPLHGLTGLPGLVGAIPTTGGGASGPSPQ